MQSKKIRTKKAPRVIQILEKTEPRGINWLTWKIPCKYISTLTQTFSLLLVKCPKFFFQGFYQIYSILRYPINTRCMIGRGYIGTIRLMRVVRSICRTAHHAFVAPLYLSVGFFDLWRIYKLMLMNHMHST